MTPTAREQGARPRILVAGMGNVLRGDDGFGIEVVRRLSARDDLPPEVRVVDVGIGGIPLVQDLLDGYEGLIIVDATHRGVPPGTLAVLQIEAPDLRGVDGGSLRTLLGDPHTTTPSRVLLHAAVLGVMPERTLLIGCEPLSCDEVGLGLSGPVSAAVPCAVNRVLEIARTWLAYRRPVAPAEAARHDTWHVGFVVRPEDP